MISIENLCFKYRGEDRLILDNINLNIKDGEFVSVMGANGSGKTTLALCVCGILKASSGKIIIDNRQLNGKDQSVKREFGVVFQNPENQLITTSVERELAFPLENDGVSLQAMKKKVTEQLKIFRIERYRYTFPGDLSGGEKQKVALASAMIPSPKYLILDEPTTFLDPHEKKEILSLINEELNSKREKGFTVILITQYLKEALNSDRIMVLSHGKVFFDNTPSKLLKNIDKLEELGISIPVEFKLENIKRSD